jgi:hypothetical protein
VAIEMRRYLIILAAGSFVLNWLWEMAQMFAYEEMAGRAWPQTVFTCTVATFGDVLTTLAVYGCIALIRRNVHWRLDASWRDYALAGALGAAIAVAIEKVAITSNQWSYTDAMPVVPMIQVGLLPLLQLTLLIPLTISVAAQFCRVGERNQTS